MYLYNNCYSSHPTYSSDKLNFPLYNTNVILIVLFIDEKVNIEHQQANEMKINYDFNFLWLQNRINDSRKSLSSISVLVSSL